MKKLLQIKAAMIFCGILFCGSLWARNTPDLLIRGPADTVGFAQYAWQMDSVLARIARLNRENLAASQQPDDAEWKTAICPHDDYAYAGWLYQAVLKNVKAKTLLIFGVAHRARNFNLENQLIFDSFDTWRSPYGPVRVSPLRDEIFGLLPKETAAVHDSMQVIEHSVEALIPFLQAQNSDIEIVSILVPYMNLERMKYLSRQLADAIHTVMIDHRLNWGEDVALLISSDAVHYGDEDWGGSNYAVYGTDSTGNSRAVAHEKEIIRNCFQGKLTETKVAHFYDYTIQKSDFKAYKWTWCGRYSIPVGLLTSIYLRFLEEKAELTGTEVAYSNSISHPHLQVEDLGMGLTGIATPRHWVGYPAIGFK